MQQITGSLHVYDQDNDDAKSGGSMGEYKKVGEPQTERHTERERESRQKDSHPLT